ncbi:PAS domain-containing protein [Aliiroseovarius sp. YM-037]|uniref:PAS domain-containing protein n=1 Tax=Aliiroseovarius sp. YM-037 TaxID=3341728 RepID=UPI003A7F671C
MTFPAIRQVEAYWDGLRRGRAVPLRSEIDPRGIESALEYAFVLERIAPGLARFRLAGMHLVDVMGMEVRGMPITSFVVPEDRNALSEALEGLFQKPETLELKLSAETGFGKPKLDAGLLLLPLKSDLGDISRALGCLVSKGAIGRAPRRFKLLECRHSQIEQCKPQITERSPVAGFAEPAEPFSSARRPHKPPKLRLVKSDD